MTDYAVTAVWDMDAEGAPPPEDLGRGLATSASYGRLVTTVYVSADDVQEATAEAFERWPGVLAWDKRIIAMAVEVASPTPHFVFGAMGC
jgi:hypothetical protein